jgi:transcriptional regulator with XRE-family HTH domain
MVTFGERMKMLRNEKGITLDELSSAIFTTKATLSRYENSKRTPNIHFAVKVAEYFGVTTDFLYGITDKKNETVTNYDDIFGFVSQSTVNAQALRDYIQFLNFQKQKKD